MGIKELKKDVLKALKRNKEINVYIGFDLHVLYMGELKPLVIELVGCSPNKSVIGYTITKFSIPDVGVVNVFLDKNIEKSKYVIK